jgi:hypothetical protein
MALNPFAEWPWTLSCFCGSGLIFRKCHKSQMTRNCTEDEAIILSPSFEKQLAEVKKLDENGQTFRLGKALL